MSKIKKVLPEERGRIHKQHNLPEDNLKFSFKFLEFSQKFHIDEVNQRYLKVFLDRLKSISNISVNDFRTNKNKSLRAHTHDWQNTSEKKGFTCLNKQLKQCESWQFQLSANEHGRVHGILIDETFYVVWLDLAHKLYN